MTGVAASAPPGGLGAFERWLSLWVAAAIVAGIGLGAAAPGLVQALADLAIGQVNLVVAVLIWAMVYPMMVGVDFGALAHIGDRPKGLVVTVVVNWLIKPFTMAAPRRALLPSRLRAVRSRRTMPKQYLAGLILLGAAPCTAMVFVWSQLCRGDPTYTLVQVPSTTSIMVFAFAPIVALLLGVDRHLRAVGDAAAVGRALRRRSRSSRGCSPARRLVCAAAARPPSARFKARVKPISVVGLLRRWCCCSASRGGCILERPLVIALIAVPLLIQSYGIFALA